MVYIKLRDHREGALSTEASLDDVDRCVQINAPIKAEFTNTGNTVRVNPAAIDYYYEV